MKSKFVNLVMIFTRIAAEVEVVMQSTNKKATPRYLRNDLSNDQSRQYS